MKRKQTNACSASVMASALLFGSLTTVVTLYGISYAGDNDDTISSSRLKQGFEISLRSTARHSTCCLPPIGERPAISPKEMATSSVET
jgi:hypothetical protein